MTGTRLGFACLHGVQTGSVNSQIITNNNTDHVSEDEEMFKTKNAMCRRKVPEKGTSKTSLELSAKKKEKKGIPWIKFDQISFCNLQINDVERV